MDEKMGTRLHINDRVITKTGAGNGETLETYDNGRGFGVVLYDCGGASRTGVILEKGQVDGQHVSVTNISDAAETITFATAATSNVASGASMVIARYESVLFIWSETLAKWQGALGGGTTIADGAVTTAKIAADAVDGTLIADDAVDSEHIVDGAVDLAHMSAESVDSDQYVDGSIDTVHIADANVTPAKTNVAEARTVTATGATTGTISDTSTFVTVTSDDANKILVLPTPTPGRVVRIVNGATGYELRSSAPTTVLINGGTGGAAVESAVGANVYLEARCVTATAWIVNAYAADGTESKLEAAA